MIILNLTFIAAPAVAHLWLKIGMRARTGSMTRERVQLNLGNGAHGTTHCYSNRAKFRLQTPWKAALGLMKKEEFSESALKTPPCFENKSNSVGQATFEWQLKYSIQTNVKTLEMSQLSTWFYSRECVLKCSSIHHDLDNVGSRNVQRVRWASVQLCRETDLTCPAWKCHS